MEHKEILVAMGGTVTIPTEEYRELVERSAYLDVLLAFTYDPKEYMLKDIACIVGDIIKKPVITDEEAEQDAGEVS